MSKHDIGELHQMQALPLRSKIIMTKQRIEAWDREYNGEWYVSFSGGKDSTVLLDIVRNVCGFKDIPAVFVDTGLEYPEIREFVKSYGDSVTWIKPKKTFKQVINEYGYPMISKEVAECVSGAKRYLQELIDENTISEQASKQAKYSYFFDKLCGQGKYAKDVSGGADNKYRKLRGIGEYSKSQDAKQLGWEQHKTCEPNGDVNERQSDKGEYP